MLIVLKKNFQQIKFLQKSIFRKISTSWYKNRQSLTHIFIYESDLNGLSFLNNYVRYIQNKTTEDFKDILKDKIFNKPKFTSKI